MKMKHANKLRKEVREQTIKEILEVLNKIDVDGVYVNWEELKQKIQVLTQSQPEKPELTRGDYSDKADTIQNKKEAENLCNKVVIQKGITKEAEEK